MNKINIVIIASLLLVAMSSLKKTYGQDKSSSSIFQKKGEQQSSLLMSQASGWVSEQRATVSFTENKGQVYDQNSLPSKNVLFMANMPTEQYIITGKGTSHQLTQVQQKQVSTTTGNAVSSVKAEGEIEQLDIYRIDMDWVNANPNPVAEKGKALPGYVNYYNVPNAEEGILEVMDYEQVILKDIYKGIDVKFYGSGSQVEYDYIVAPGADYKQIKIKISGTEAKLNKEGELELNSPLGMISESAPKVFQEGIELAARWKQTNISEWGFEIDGYNPTLAMVIDPISRAWGTYYGGSNEDMGYSCSLDSMENVYLAGRSWSNNSIATFGAHQSTISSDYDAFLVKFNSNGVRLWGSYYGGNGQEFDGSCITDNSGNVYLTGTTYSTNNIATVGSHQSTHAYGSPPDAFIVKFNSNGVRQWGTYYGGSGQELYNSCATDTAGNVYLAGSTQSTNNIATPGAHRAIGYSNGISAFLVKFNSNGVRQWGTYYGGEFSYFGAHATTIGNSCVADDNGNIFLSGSTRSISEIATPGSHQNANNNVNGGDQAFLVKFNSNGVRQWGTYYGGTSADYSYACAVDHNGYVFLTGEAGSATNIATPGAHQTSFGRIFLVKFDSTGVCQWGTYYGSNLSGKGRSCALDSSGNIYVAGETVSSTNIATPGAYQSINYGNDAFLVKFNGNGVRQWGTYYGGSDNDYIYSCAVTDNGFVYSAGYTRSSNNIASTGAHQPAFGSTNAGQPDAFLVKFVDCSQANISSNLSSNSPVCPGGDLHLNSNATGGTAPYTYLWSGGFVYTSILPNPTFNNVPPFASGNYKLIVTDVNGCQKIDSIPVSIINTIIIITDSIVSVCDGENVYLNSSASGGTGPYTYSWQGVLSFSSSQQNNVINNPGTSASGNYSITITDTQGCTNSKGVSVTVHQNPTGTISVTDNTKCSGVCNGSATAVPSAGGYPYSYLWSNGQTTDVASSLCQGIYDVVITDVNSCQSAIIPTTVVTVSIVNPEVYLTNLAAIDQINISPSFAAFYTYNLPASITAPPSNPRNFVDPGKKARFKVECTNEKFNGQSIVSGICKVRSNNPYITITDSSSALNNIGWNDKAWSADEFEINIDPNTPPGTNAYIDFIVQESGQEYATTCIAIPITPLVYSPTTPFTIDDDSNPDSQGNDNDICDANEIIEFYPWLDNISTLDAEFVRGRLENLDNHSYINIWNSVPGINTTVYDAGWWNYSFAQPQTVTSNSFNTTPEYDFVFNYNNTNIITDFKLYMVMAGGFKLFSGTALSLVQWALPFTFAATGSTAIGNEIENIDGLSVYPNPSNGNVLFSMDNSQIQHIKIYNQIGTLVYQSEKETQELDLTGYPKGVYLIQVQSGDKIIYKRVVIQ